MRTMYGELYMLHTRPDPLITLSLPEAILSQPQCNVVAFWHHRPKE